MFNLKKIAPILLVQHIATSLTCSYHDKALAVQHAWWLVEKITHSPKSQLLIVQEIIVSKEQEEQLASWLHAITIEHKPIQYILGTVPFIDLEIMVEAPILIPRPETEEWVTSLCSRLQKLENKNLKIMDIGTGTGCIALALAQSLPESTITAVDINQHALELAKKNAQRNDIHNVEFVLSDLFEKVTDTFDIIISNPPYISEEEFTSLDVSVATWEDKRALVARDHGLELIKKIIDQAPIHILNNKELDASGISNVCIEIGYQQGSCVANLMKQAGYLAITIHKDLQKNDRVVKGSVVNVAKNTAQKSGGKHHS